ncbi:MAG: hypothetical protein ABSB15_20935 [Bryobacteraceae bacterium]
MGDCPRANSVYLVTCPKTTGSATGEGGFWQRWQENVRTGHGGNVALKNRPPSGYQVSIPQVAGTDASAAAVIATELWKITLQSKEMGLNP